MQKTPMPTNQLPVTDWIIDIPAQMIAAVFTFSVLDPKTGQVMSVQPLFMNTDQVVKLHSNLSDLIQHLKPVDPNANLN